MAERGITDVSDAKMNARTTQKSPAMIAAQPYSDSPTFHTGTNASISNIATTRAATRLSIAKSQTCFVRALISW